MMTATDGTGKGLLEFLEWAGTRGELNASTARVLGSSSKKILEVEADYETVQMAQLEPDSLADRFETLHRADYASASMSAYISRFRTAHAMYLAWLDKRPDWKSLGPSSRRAAKRGPSGGTDSGMAKSPSVQNDSDLPDQIPLPTSDREQMVSYDLPLRPGLRARLVLPEDLTSRDAARVASFVNSLAFEPAVDSRESD